MNIGTVEIRLNEARATEVKKITAGMIGATVEFIFDDMWESYQKTIVWKAGNVIKDDTTASGVVPAEVLAVAGTTLHVGVYGVTDGVATPTVWACLGAILSGAEPGGDDTTDPSLPVWAQVLQEMEKLKGGGYVVDDELDENSENPVQNKVITTEFGAALAGIEQSFENVYAALPPDASESNGDGFALVTQNGKWVIADAPMCTKSDIYGASSSAAAAHERIDELETTANEAKASATKATTTANTAKSSAEAAQLQAMQAKTAADNAVELANDFSADIGECLNRINSLEYTAGNINTALDAIIAIQESLIGGDA